MTIPVLDYDPAEDGRRSYEAAIAAKKARGDTHWPERPMTGLWSSLTDEQRNLALAYRGDETLGAPLGHVPVTASPSPWLFRITIACAVFWAAVIAWWAA